MTFKNSTLLHGIYVFVWISEQTVTFALYDIKRVVFITEAESVYSAVRTESLYTTQIRFVFTRLNVQIFTKIVNMSLSYKQLSTAHYLQVINSYSLRQQTATVR